MEGFKEIRKEENKRINEYVGDSLKQMAEKERDGKTD